MLAWRWEGGDISSDLWSGATSPKVWKICFPFCVWLEKNLEKIPNLRTPIHTMLTPWCQGFGGFQKSTSLRLGWRTGHRSLLRMDSWRSNKISMEQIETGYSWIFNNIPRQIQNLDHLHTCYSDFPTKKRIVVYSGAIQLSWSFEWPL